MIIDLHVHTRMGSGDSRIDPHELHDVVQRFDGLDGVVLAEHERCWTREDLEEHHPGEIVIVNAREVTTTQGHVIVIGVPDVHLERARSLEELRTIVVDNGGASIIAHPFRHYPSPWNLLFPGSRDHRPLAELHEGHLATLAEHPIFGLVDAVEVANGGCTSTQNDLAAAMARIHGLPAVGGSDAHDVYAVGWYATAVPDDVHDDRTLVRALQDGRVTPARRVRTASAYAWLTDL